MGKPPWGSLPCLGSSLLMVSMLITVTTMLTFEELSILAGGAVAGDHDSHLLQLLLRPPHLLQLGLEQRKVIQR